MLDLQELSIRTVEHVAMIALYEWYELLREGSCLGCLPVSYADYYVSVSAYN